MYSRELALVIDYIERSALVRMYIKVRRTAQRCKDSTNRIKKKLHYITITTDTLEHTHTPHTRPVDVHRVNVSPPSVKTIYRLRTVGLNIN